MKKKVLALFLATVMVVPTLSACGGSSDSGAAKSDTATEESTSDDAAAATDDAAAEDAEASGSDEEVTLTIWDWDEAHLTHMTEWYHEKHPNVNFETLVVSTADYFQKLQSAVASGSGVPDIILSEMGYRGKVFDLGILEDLYQAPYNVQPDDMFDFANKLGAGPDGQLYGVEQQICPSGFAYRRDLAKEYLGTDDPDEIADMISDWDKLYDIGKQVVEKSGGKVTVLPGTTVLLNGILINQDVSDYIDGDTIDLTTRYKNVLDIAAKFNQAGILGKQEDSTPALNNSYAAGEVLFYPCAPWSLKWGIGSNDPEGSGNWGLTKAPGDGFTYGGTSVSIYSGSENKEAAWEYIQDVYCTGDGVKEAYEQFGFMTGFKAPYEGTDSYFLTEDGQYDEFFGGQKLADYFINTIAITTEGQIQTKNEANVRSALSSVATQMTGNPDMTADEALEALKTETQTLIPGATLK
ncbi:MAG: extracellular solute-binding protein [Clostridia bacterium]|nr:extracellular solute-binding protein [Clostridia bacterium]NCC42028.1 extracellular solute-binding protein [Clostridia bacterium]